MPILGACAKGKAMTSVGMMTSSSFDTDFAVKRNSSAEVDITAKPWPLRVKLNLLPLVSPFTSYCVRLMPPNGANSTLRVDLTPLYPNPALLKNRNGSSNILSVLTPPLHGNRSFLNVKMHNDTLGIKGHRCALVPKLFPTLFSIFLECASERRAPTKTRWLPQRRKPRSA